MALSALTSLTIAACFAFALHGCGGGTETTPPPGDKPKNIVELAVSVPTLSKLVEAVTKAGLAETLKGEGPFTVFAPTDDAFNTAYPNGFDALTKEQVASLLKYHVISGKITSGQLKATQMVDTLETPKKLTITKNEAGDVTVGPTAKVSAADNDASNGVVHIIDKVLTVPNDIVELAVASSLSKLVEAVTKAGLAETLKGEGPFTVFAPTDDAFNTAYPNGFDALTKEQVASLLKYHVISGKITSGQLKATQMVDTLETPKKLTITKNEAGDVTVGPTAKVSAADNDAYNGVVHIIDTVLTIPNFVALV